MKVKKWWYNFRHEVYYLGEIIGPSGGDDTARIQAAIDTASSASNSDAMFRQIERHYNRKWYRFFIKKPVLVPSVYFGAGTFKIKRPIVISNIGITGSGRGATIIDGQNRTPEVIRVKR